MKNADLIEVAPQRVLGTLSASSWCVSEAPSQPATLIARQRCVYGHNTPRITPYAPAVLFTIFPAASVLTTVLATIWLRLGVDMGTAERKSYYLGTLLRKHDCKGQPEVKG